MKSRKMMPAEDKHGLISKREMREFIKQEVEKQTRGILKKPSASAELLPGPQHYIRDSGVADIGSIETPEITETTVLLESLEELDYAEQLRRTLPRVNKLETTADSLLDVRVERLKRASRTDDSKRRFQNYNNRSNMAANYTRTVIAYRNRGEIYCCYAVYFFLVFWVFIFAIFYVWLPIINNIMKGKKHLNNTQFNNHY